MRKTIVTSKKILVCTVLGIAMAICQLMISHGVAVAEAGTDAIPPTIARVSVDKNPLVVKVIFSEPVEQASAETVSNYGIDHSIQIISAILEEDKRTVTLAISEPSDLIPNPDGQTDDWSLLFHDEFDGNSLDQNKWATCYWWWGHWRVGDGCTNEATAELEFYKKDNVIVSNGTLKLQARQQEVITLDADGFKRTYHYTSGMITTGRDTSDRAVPAKFLFQYGYAEIKAKIPSGQGLWPAFWTLPDDHNSRPEIDVMEILGHEPNEVHFHLHNNDIDPGETWSGLNLSEDWHTFAVDWQPDALIWYVDGIERWRYSDTQNIPISPSYLLLNLAVGGYWPGSPDASTPFPSDFEIDYVRVWQIGENASSDDVIYALTVNNINDCATNPNKILPNTVKTFTFDDTNPPRPPANFHIVSN